MAAKLAPRWPPEQNRTRGPKIKKATKLLSLVAFYGSDGRGRSHAFNAQIYKENLPRLSFDHGVTPRFVV